MTESVISYAGAKEAAQAWLRSPAWDCFWIIGPAFVTSILALLFKNQIESMRTLPLWAWVCFVLLVDVAHVYATLFRSYLDKNILEKNSTLLFAIPAACWGVGALLFSVDALLFWRVLAYLAVFHFIRQQYGFLALYSRKEAESARRFRRLDEVLIYLVTLYPLLFWHTNLPRNFNWFVEGDFIESIPSVAADVCLGLYLLTAAAYIVKEAWVFKSSGYFNQSKNLLILGTALSWWVAIVPINSDFSFTMINVISHGVPYMALVWLYHHAPLEAALKTSSREASSQAWQTGVKFILAFAPAFIFFLAILAYLEEGLWDALIWREHTALFRPFSFLPAINDHSVLALLIPLLSLPQSSHYVLDGFIWRLKDRGSLWSVAKAD
ncbi:MAG: hypothetical protein K2X27_03805 [Candidatus Obscuribacterales bacterium]|nr:hypothetical protein [Candidatus Obscuribacterales bacterium]